MLRMTWPYPETQLCFISVRKSQGEEYRIANTSKIVLFIVMVVTVLPSLNGGGDGDGDGDGGGIHAKNE